MEIDSSLLSSLMWWNTSEGLESNDAASQSSSQPWWTQDSTSDSSNTDVFSLSSELSAIQQQFQFLSQSIATKLGVQEIKGKAQDRADALQTDLLAAFEENGIDIGDGVNLTMDKDGIVRVFGQHDNKEAIESFFMKNANWSERYADFHIYSDIAYKLEQYQNGTSSSSNPYLQKKQSEKNTVLSIGSGGVAEIQHL